MVAGQPVNVLLEWQLAGDQPSADIRGWPQGLAAFVHLRRERTNINQADGPPQWFGQPAAAFTTVDMGQAGGENEVLNDWRQVTPPVDAELSGKWSVVAGVYDTQTGERLLLHSEPAANEGDEAGTASDELVLGTVRVVSPPPPDQACALLPATCQPVAD
jgi:hypothetical protein